MASTTLSQSTTSTVLASNASPNDDVDSPGGDDSTIQNHNDSQDKTRLNAKEESTQDWKVNAVSWQKLPAPSFVRLFVIKRIICKYSSINDISDLVNVFKDKNKRETAQKILENLIKLGLKTYMTQYFDEDKQGQIIESIFQNIILVKFEKEYQEIITYTSCKMIMNNKDVDINHKTNSYNQTNDNKSSDWNQDKEKQKEKEKSKEEKKEHYKNILFNTDDLMCTIFQFLSDFQAVSEREIRHTAGRHDTKNNLVYSSLVCSHWLYSVFNQNSIYFIDLGKIIGNHRLEWRQWQRFINAKYVRLGSLYMGVYPDRQSSTLRRLLMFNNIEMIDGDFLNWTEHVEIFKLLMSHCSNNLKLLDVCARSGAITHFDDGSSMQRQFRLSSLRLPSAEYIGLYGQKDVKYNIIWSKHCHTLKFESNDAFDKEDFALYEMNETNLKFVINNCDCSGIRKLLNVANIKFDVNDMYNISKLKQRFSGLFTGLTEIYINYHEIFDKEMSFIEYLHDIVSNNNGYSTLEINFGELCTLDVIKNNDKNFRHRLFDTKSAINCVILKPAPVRSFACLIHTHFHNLIKNQYDLGHYKFEKFTIDMTKAFSKRHNDVIQLICNYIKSRMNPWFRSLQMIKFLDKGRVFDHDENKSLSLSSLCDILDLNGNVAIREGRFMYVYGYINFAQQKQDIRKTISKFYSKIIDLLTKMIPIDIMIRFFDIVVDYDTGENEHEYYMSTIDKLFKSIDEIDKENEGFLDNIARGIDNRPQNKFCRLIPKPEISSIIAQQGRIDRFAVKKTFQAKIRIKNVEYKTTI